VYGLTWSRVALIFYYDGIQMGHKTGGYISDLFGKLQMVTLNLDVGGDYYGNPDLATLQTGTMQVDWVKVFTPP
jgi:hypothetical protein